MSTKRKSRKRTGSFKRGNPKEAKSALSAMEEARKSIASRSLGEMVNYCSTASGQAADLKGQLSLLVSMAHLVGLEFMRETTVGNVIVERLKAASNLATDLYNTLRKGTPSTEILLSRISGEKMSIRTDYLSLSAIGMDKKQAIYRALYSGRSLKR